MRRSFPPLTLLALLVAAGPTEAQEMALGVFVTVSGENTADFEEAAIEHSNWHRDQGDTQPWPVYQAITGRHAEYVFVAPGMTGASFDNPTIDLAADQAHWNDSGARYADSEDIQLWMQLTDVSNPLPDDMTADYPVVRVVEFEIRSGGDGAVMNGLRMYKEAIAAQAPGLYFVWDRVISADQPPSMFIAVWGQSFEALLTPGASPMQTMINQFGAEGGTAMVEAFTENTRVTADRIWTFRPDLSYIPGM